MSPVPFQASFSAGEIDPALYARIDLAKYQIGLTKAENFICGLHGRAFNRAGTKFVAEVKDSSKVHRLIPFQFSTVQSYALEFGENTMRVFKDGATVTESDVTISGATQADPVVITATAHGYSNGDWIIITGVVGMTQLNGKTFKVANKTANTFELNDINDNNIDGTGFSAYTSGGVCNRIYEIATPYASADLSELAYTQSADVMYITHPDYFPRKLSRTGHTAWTIETLPFVDGPYSPRVSGDEDITITPAARSGNNVAIISNENIFSAAMVGAPFRVGYVNPNDVEDLQWGWGTIDQFTDPQTARLDITEPFGFEFINNVDFDSGISFWEDHSTLLSTFTYDAGNKAAVLTTGATGDAEMRQAILNVIANVVYKIEVNVLQVDLQFRLQVGSTTGATNYLNQTITTTGLKTFTFTPTGSEVHISIPDAGSVAADVTKITSLSIIRNDLSSDNWRQPAWTSDNGYPQAVTFFEQRLFFAGTSSEPQTVWSSIIADFENFGFTSPSLDTDGLVYTLDAQQVNAIQWMRTNGFIVAGTSHGEWKMFSGSNQDAMTPSSIFAKEQTFFGSSAPGLLPPTIDNSLLFVKRGSQAVIDLFLSPEKIEGLDGRDVIILSSHLLEGFNILEWAYASLPDRVLWSVRDDGTLLGFTFMKEQEVAAWHRHVTQGNFESVAVVSSVSTDETYFIVEREIDGNTVRYVEILQERITNETIFNYFFVDSGLTYSGAAATTISGLDHLEGEVVSVLADGEFVEGKTVTNGQITISNAAELIHVGLPFVADLETLNIETGDREGATQGKKKIVGEINLHLLKTRGALVGSDENKLTPMVFSNEADGDDPPALFTGKKEINIKDRYNKEKRIFIRQTAPLPITILSIIPEIVNSES